METGVYEEIVRQLMRLPTEKVLEVKHYVDFLERQQQRRLQGLPPRFDDLCAPPAPEDDPTDCLLETVIEGYQTRAPQAIHS